MSGRVVVVTGSEGGIGQEIVRAFEEAGETVERIDQVCGTDVTDPAACRRVVEEIVARHGRIDVLCNNAGVGAAGDVVSATPADWQRVFAVNVFGAANMTAAVVPAMRAAGRGVVVNTCSVVATVGFRDRVVYSASKGALLAFTRAVAADEVRFGIRVNSVSPATVEGRWVQRNAEASGDADRFLEEMRRRQPIGDLISAVEVARAVVFLAHDDTQMTGVDVAVDGGTTGLRIVGD